MSEQEYYVPHGTYWPIIGSIGVSTLFVGFANQMHGAEWGGSVMALVVNAISAFIYDLAKPTKHHKHHNCKTKRHH